MADGSQTESLLDWKRVYVHLYKTSQSAMMSRSLRLPPPQLRPAVLIGDCDQLCVAACSVAQSWHVPSFFYSVCFVSVCETSCHSKTSQVLSIDYYSSVSFGPVGFPPSFLELFTYILVHFFKPISFILLWHDITGIAAVATAVL